MKDNLSFSIDEMSQLEALDIKGGQTAPQASQAGCSNHVLGCACPIIIVPQK